MQFEPVNIIQIAIASPAALLGAGLVARPRFRALALLLVIFAVHMSFNVWEETGAAQPGYLVTPALSLLYGPLIYLFIRGLIIKNGFIGLRDLVHFAPTLIALFLTEWLGVVRVATVISLLTYGVAGLASIWRFHRAAASVRSDALSIRLNWIIAIFAGFAVLAGLDVIRALTVTIQPAGFMQFSYAVSMIAVALLFGTLGYFAITRPRYFSGLTDEEFRAPSTVAAVVENPPLEDQKAFETVDRIVMESRLYLEPHLTLFDLANASGLPERDISRLINQIVGRNFCDYINSFRVKEAARLLGLEENGPKTILAIAFEAGFASKSTFNAVFKAETGETPSAFRRRVGGGSE